MCCVYKRYLACRVYAKGMTSVSLSVTLVDCDHKQWKSAYDRIGQCFNYLQAEAIQIVVCDPKFY